MNKMPNMSGSTVTFAQPSFGLSPAGFTRLHVEVLPKEVGRIVGYDPRSLVMKPRKPGVKTARGTRDLTPHNVSKHIVELQNRVQRSIDTKRVRIMVDYLVGAMERAEFADWGPIELVTSSEPDLSRLDADHIAMMDSDADYFIADGQHRYCAILDFTRDYPQYADKFTQAITISVMPEDRLDVWAGQAFHDRNYFASPVRAGKALAVDARDHINILAKDLASHPTIERAGGIAYERDTLLAGDPRFTTHSVLHRFVKGFIFGRPGLDKSTDVRGDIDPADAANLDEYLSMLEQVMHWTGEERDAYLSRASAVLSALAVIGYDLYHNDMSPEERRMRIGQLGRLDWSKGNLNWVGVLGAEKNGMVQPASSRPAIDGTIRFLRSRLGLLKEQGANGQGN